MSRWVTIWAFFCCFAVSNGPGSIDSEDVNVLQALLEDQEIQELKIGREQSRIRLIPEFEKETVFYRSVIGRGRWRGGLRIDHLTGEERTRLSKLFIEIKGTRTKVLLGNLKLERAQGLLFGNIYGRFASTTAPFAFTKTRERIGADLTSYVNAGVSGSLIEIKSTSLTHEILLGNCPLDVKRNELGELSAASGSPVQTINRNLAAYLLAGNSRNGRFGVSVVGEHFGEAVGGKNGNISFSIFSEETVSHFRIAGEGVLSGRGGAYVLNLIYRDTAFSWFLHQRYFSPGYQPLVGSPFADYGDGNNETGWIAGTQYKSQRIIVNTWLGFSNQLTGENGHIRNEGYDRLIYIRFTEFLQGTLELRFRQREKFTLQHLDQDLIEHEYWSPVRRKYSTVTYAGSGTGNFKVKVSHVSYRPQIEEDESGTLLSFLFPVVSWKLLKAHYGLHLFHTDSWNSRLYDYEHSLPGEFRLIPFYETGAEAYGTCRLELNRGVDLGLRISYEWKTTQNFTHDPQVAIQIDIHR